MEINVEEKEERKIEPWIESIKNDMRIACLSEGEVGNTVV